MDFLNVLESQRQLYTSEDQLVQSERGIVVNLVALYKALGGGWELFSQMNGMGGPAVRYCPELN